VFDDWKQERAIFRTLKALTRRRVKGVLQPSGEWVIEKAGYETKDTEANLATCVLRGWIIPYGPSHLPRTRARASRRRW